MPTLVGKMTRGAVFNHLIDLGGLGTNAPTAKTVGTDRLAIDTDVATYIVDGEGGADDDIDGISGFNEGQFLLLHAATGRTITLKDENAGAAATTDRIRTMGGTDQAFGDDEAVLLYHDDTLDRWIVIAGPASGGGGNSFETINCPAGTDPVADSSTDTLNLTSANTRLTITGDSATDAVDFAVVEGNIDHNALANTHGTPVLASAFPLTITGPAASDLLQWNGSAWVDRSLAEAGVQAAGAYLLNIVEDVTPQLGADLDCNTFSIQFDDATGIEDDSGNELLRFQKTASAVNHIDITNAATGNGPIIEAEGEANVALTIKPKGTGVLTLGLTGGDGTFGETGGTVRAWRPVDDENANLGTSSYRWNQVNAVSFIPKSQKTWTLSGTPTADRTVAYGAGVAVTNHEFCTLIQDLKDAGILA